MMNSRLKNGYMAEERFILECLHRDIPISRPIYNVESYDFVIQVNGNFVSVQVKKSWVDKRGLNLVCIKSSYPRSAKTRIVTKQSSDYLAVLVNDDWYIIPCTAFEGKVSAISVSPKGDYGMYFNNWDFV